MKVVTVAQLRDHYPDGTVFSVACPDEDTDGSEYILCVRTGLQPRDESRSSDSGILFTVLNPYVIPDVVYRGRNCNLWPRLSELHESGETVEFVEDSALLRERDDEFVIVYEARDLLAMRNPLDRALAICAGADVWKQAVPAVIPDSIVAGIELSVREHVKAAVDTQWLEPMRASDLDHLGLSHPNGCRVITGFGFPTETWYRMTNDGGATWSTVLFARNQFVPVIDVWKMRLHWHSIGTNVDSAVLYTEYSLDKLPDEHKAWALLHLRSINLGCILPVPNDYEIPKTDYQTMMDALVEGVTR